MALAKYRLPSTIASKITTITQLPNYFVDENNELSVGLGDYTYQLLTDFDNGIISDLVSDDNHEGLYRQLTPDAFFEISKAITPQDSTPESDTQVHSSRRLSVHDLNGHVIAVIDSELLVGKYNFPENIDISELSATVYKLSAEDCVLSGVKTYVDRPKSTDECEDEFLSGLSPEHLITKDDLFSGLANYSSVLISGARNVYKMGVLKNWANNQERQESVEGTNVIGGGSSDGLDPTDNECKYELQGRYTFRIRGEESNEWVVPQTGTMVVFGSVMTGSTIIHNVGNAWIGLFVKIRQDTKSKWAMIAVKSIVPEMPLTYVSFNVPVKKGATFKLKTGFQVNQNQDLYNVYKNTNNSILNNVPNSFLAGVYRDDMSIIEDILIENIKY